MAALEINCESFNALSCEIQHLNPDDDGGDDDDGHITSSGAVINLGVLNDGPLLKSDNQVRADKTTWRARVGQEEREYRPFFTWREIKRLVGGGAEWRQLIISHFSGPISAAAAAASSCVHFHQKLQPTSGVVG